MESFCTIAPGSEGEKARFEQLKRVLEQQFLEVFPKPRLASASSGGVCRREHRTSRADVQGNDRSAGRRSESLVTERMRRLRRWVF